MIRLNVNIDHVATLRNQRDVPYPDPAEAAHLCLLGGADGITMHLREDRRHVRQSDVEKVRRLVSCGLNLEMAATEEMAQIAASVRPDAITLVPEKREERTTEGGLDVRAAGAAILRIGAVAQAVGARLSLFIEPNLADVRLARELGAVQVEFHTGHFCDAQPAKRLELLPAFVEAATVARELGLEVAAGHGLNCENVGQIARLPHLVELNIGHSVIADAIMVGMTESVRRLRAAVNAALARG